MLPYPEMESRVEDTYATNVGNEPKVSLAKDEFLYQNARRRSVGNLNITSDGSRYRAKRPRPMSMPAASTSEYPTGALSSLGPKKSVSFFANEGRFSMRAEHGPNKEPIYTELGSQSVERSSLRATTARKWAAISVSQAVEPAPLADKFTYIPPRKTLIQRLSLRIKRFFQHKRETRYLKLVPEIDAPRQPPPVEIPALPPRVYTQQRGYASRSFVALPEEISENALLSA